MVYARPEAQKSLAQFREMERLAKGREWGRSDKAKVVKNCILRGEIKEYSKGQRNSILENKR